MTFKIYIYIYIYIWCNIFNKGQTGPRLWSFSFPNNLLVI